jgi:hypothetical protein
MQVPDVYTENGEFTIAIYTLTCLNAARHTKHRTPNS